jgi:hypothetical protein
MYHFVLILNRHFRKIDLLKQQLKQENKDMNRRLTLIAAFIAGLLLATALIWITGTDAEKQPLFSELEIHMLTDYESALFKEIDVVTAEREWNEYLNSIKFPENLEDVRYYELKYENVHEFHVTGYKSDGNHFIAAVPVQKIVQ